MLSHALSTSNLSRSCPRFNNNDPVPSSTKSNHHCGRLYHRLSQRSCSVKILSTLIGQKVHASQTAILADTLYYRALQHLHLQAVSHHGHAGNVIVPLTPQVRGDLELWVSESCCRLNGRPIQVLPITPMLTCSDFSSLKAVGGRIFQSIFLRFYTPKVDLFASHLNHQVAKHVSRYPDPGILSIDAFFMDWSIWTCVTYPLVVLLPWILRKIKEVQATAFLLIAPNWIGQPWFLELIQMLVDRPLLLPQRQSLLFFQL